MFEGIDLEHLPAALEALLFVTDEPVSALTLADMLNENVEEIELALEDLQKRLDGDSRGIQLREVAGGWRLYTHPAYHDLIEQYVVSWDTRKLLSAALETLAVIAYGQPITKAQISAVRGVNSESALNTLIERGYVREAGVVDAPGQPILYATTDKFLEHFGISDLRELPPLPDPQPVDKDEEPLTTG